MKISKERLKELIAEEIAIGFAQPSSCELDECDHEDHGDSDGSMAKQNLWKMAEYAKELYSLIEDSDDLEPWVEEKIAIASFMMDSVGHYMQYQKHSTEADISMSADDLEHGEEPEEEEEFFFDPEENDSEEF